VRDAGDHEKKNLRLRRSSSWHQEPASKENPQFKLKLLTKCADKVSEKNNNRRPVFFFLVRDTETETRESLQRKEERKHKMHISRSARDLRREAYRRAK
jgi:hypothetical protein